MRLGEPQTDRVGSARQAHLERNKAAGVALRAEKDRIFHRDLAREMANEPRASHHEVMELSALLNVAQVQVVPPWESPSWFKLFKYVDADGSGLITFDEMVSLARDILKLSERDVPEKKLKALWLALDTDCSGHLTSGEFGNFMRLGAPAVTHISPLDRRRLLAEASRRELEEATAEAVRWEVLKTERDLVELELRTIQLTNRAEQMPPTGRGAPEAGVAAMPRVAATDGLPHVAKLGHVSPRAKKKMPLPADPPPIPASEVLQTLKAARAAGAAGAAGAVGAAGAAGTAGTAGAAGAPAPAGETPLTQRVLSHHDFVLDQWLGPEYTRRQVQLQQLKQQFAMLEAEYEVASPGLGRVPVWDWGEYLEYGGR